jgi:mannose-6-phosphate isomerase
LGSKHRIINEQEEPLIFIEVQVGDYFGEDDIVRIEDDYGRED